MINKNDKVMAQKGVLVGLSNLILSGTKSKTDTVIITPEAKLREFAIILFLFLNFKKISIVPSRVEEPANAVNKNAN